MDAVKTAELLLVRRRDAGSRLDLFVAEAAGLSRRRARSLIGGSAVLRNGRPIRVQSKVVEFGDVIELPSQEIVGGFSPWRPPAPTFVHDDPWLAAVDKPSGMLTQPAETGGPDDLALDEAVALTLAQREGRPPFVRTLHRLDRLTSGLVLFARAPRALRPLDRAWRKGLVRRLYLAVTDGPVKPSVSTVIAPIGRDPGHPWRFRVDAEGREAESRIRVLHSGADTSLLCCELLTGRTHQARVHLAHIGHPVLGDRLYNGARAGVDRPLLHAWGLSLPHPEDGRSLRLEAAPPEAFEPFLPKDGPAGPWSVIGDRHDE